MSSQQEQILLEKFGKTHDNVESILKKNGYFGYSSSDEGPTDADRSKAFTVWYLMKRHEIGENEAKSCVLDISYDRKIDAIYSECVRGINYIYIYQTKYYEADVPTDQVEDLEELWDNIKQYYLYKKDESNYQAAFVFGHPSEERVQKIESALSRINKNDTQIYVVFLTATGCFDPGNEILDDLENQIEAYDDISNISLQRVEKAEIDAYLK